MAHAALESALADGGRAFGGWITQNWEAAVGAMDRAGYDFIGFDCQHGTLSETDAAHLVRRMGSARPATIVRVSSNSLMAIGKVLDAGADGVIVPLVNNADEARAAVAACVYPPDGMRSFGPNRPGMPFTTAELGGRVSCFVMIETLEGLGNADEICAVPGVAGIVIGPADLSISLGMDPLQGFASDQIFDALSQVRAACEKHGIVLGIFAGGAASVAKWTGQGARLLIIGSDMGLLSQAAAADNALARSEAAPAATATPYAT